MQQGTAALGSLLAQHEFFDSTYEALRRIARGLLRTCGDCSLDATDLVHQTIVTKLAKLSKPVAGRDHYLGLAIHGMRQVIVDHARRRLVRRRPLRPEGVVKIEHPELAVMVKRELQRLARTDPRAARIVESRELEHKTWQEIAASEQIPVRTARDDYNFAIAWLRARFCGDRA